MEKDSGTAVCVKNACKYYGTKQILDQFNMRVQKGMIYGLLGASGCGKTTLLSCIVGRKTLNSGNIWALGGVPGTPQSGVPGPRVGYMPQDVALVPEFTVKGAVYYFGRIAAMTEEMIEQKFQILSQLLDLPPTERFIKNCSGGQQRRVSFAAAMVSSPELLILDEPTVGLDPVLRESIWNYLIEITEKENATVIITTHYIEETRQAHKIGLMRQGRLLAEGSPEKLLNFFHTDSLEEVFLILSRQQAEGRVYEVQSENMIDDIDVSVTQSTSSTVSMVMTDLNSSKDDLTPKENDKQKQFILNGYRMKALLVKNWMQLTRSPNMIGFMFVFPIIQILAFFLAVGNDVKNIKIGVINAEDHFSECGNYSVMNTVTIYDENECSFSQLGCRFIHYLEDPMIKLIPFDNLEKAMNGILHGDVAGVLYIPENFSKSLEKKLSMSLDISNNKALSSSQIDAYLDMSNRQIGTTIKYKLIDKIIDFQKDIYKDCNYEIKLGEIPVRFEEDVYGHLNETFRVFMIPGVLLTIMFFMGTTNTSSVIISDRLEGVWDRSIIAGVSSMEILLTHFITQILLVIMQTIIVFILTFVIYQTEYLGNFATITAIVMLQGACGMAFGFLVSIITSSHNMAHFMTSGSFYPMILLCGLVWPLEGMPIGLRWFAKCLPFTIPIISLRNVIKKGWSFSHADVLNGIGIEILWIVGLVIISAIELKRIR